jgi:multiple sugar transport system permease protein
LVLVSFLWTFNNFSIANVLYGSTPSPSADVLSLHIYNVSFNQWNFGLASAMAFLVMIFLLGVVVAYVKVFSIGRGVRET